MNENKETSASFARNVLASDVPVLVDFWAPWCGPCKQLSPVLDALTDEFSNKFVLSKVNVDDEPKLANTYNVKAIPTMILFVDGKEQARLVGAVPKAEIVKLIDKHVLAKPQ